MSPGRLIKSYTCCAFGARYSVWSHLPICGHHTMICAKVGICLLNLIKSKHDSVSFGIIQIILFVTKTVQNGLIIVTSPPPYFFLRDLRCCRCNQTLLVTRQVHLYNGLTQTPMHKPNICCVDCEN